MTFELKINPNLKYLHDYNLDGLPTRTFLYVPTQIRSTNFIANKTTNLFRFKLTICMF